MYVYIIYINYIVYINIYTYSGCMALYGTCNLQFYYMQWLQPCIHDSWDALGLLTQTPQSLLATLELPGVPKHPQIPPTFLCLESCPKCQRKTKPTAVAREVTTPQTKTYFLFESPAKTCQTLPQWQMASASWRFGNWVTSVSAFPPCLGPWDG